ncbi:ATP-grasp domain-containing protein [Pseudoprevotella muciniphila]|uniref:ATP-grasp domain-containing protein n=1 Tax=Pseudoprevotella muciniphila TaxID=2133944 RepID=A0A5P8E8T9_9BACT|nr:ATP-grasp domain-containing protein [Pseudoprevotella muciniphila]QFQ13411.1 ATP-grasp domain-containing protein [Pseudoprevotella muciniphila]
MKIKQAIILGDATNNTLGVVRSLGLKKVPLILILIAEKDPWFVSESKYVRHGNLYRIKNIEELMPLLLSIHNSEYEQSLMCTFDEVAMFIDKHEEELSKLFRTPARGSHILQYFNKATLCDLAEKCGLEVPRTIIYNRSEDIPTDKITFPVMIKPLHSIEGAKEDIHKCNNKEELQSALQAESNCPKFVIQEYIEKDFELDVFGVRTEEGVIIPGGVRKIRHFPAGTGAGAYGIFLPTDELKLDIPKINELLKQTGYYGLFSIEFLRKGERSIFMEVNFRNDGIAYAATVGGVNLPEIYINPISNAPKARKNYMMNYSIDFLYVKSGEVPLRTWLRDFFRTRCFINFNRHDTRPTRCYYWHKIKSKFYKNR